MDRDEPIPSFWQPRYPKGHYRGRYLMGLAGAFNPDVPRLQLLDALCLAVDGLLSEKPNLDTRVSNPEFGIEVASGQGVYFFRSGRNSRYIGQALAT